MARNTPQKQLPFHLDLVIRHRLGRTLLTGLLAAALVPSVMLGIAGYMIADSRLTEEIHRRLLSVADLQRLNLQHRFNDGGSAETAGDALRDGIGLRGGAAPGDREGWRTYLLDRDGTLIVGDTGPHGWPDDLSAPTTPAVHAWQRLAAPPVEAPPPAVPAVYSGPDGKRVLGTAVALWLGDTPYLLVVEREHTVAFAHRRGLRTVWVAITVMASVGALAIALALADRIATPVDALARRLYRASRGALSRTDHLMVGNEIDTLARAAAAVIDRLRGLTAACDTHTHHLDALARLQVSLAAADSAEAIGSMAVEQLADAMGLASCRLFTVDQNGGVVCTDRYPARTDHAAQGVMDPRIDPAARAMKRRTPLCLRIDETGQRALDVARPTQATLIMVPLVAGQRVHGALALERTGGFSIQESRLAHAASAVVTAALDAASRHRPGAGGHRGTEALRAREAALQSQRRAFRVAEEKLQLNQLELEAANAQMKKNAADLERHMAVLQRQQKAMQQQNVELARTHRKLAEKARQLELSSRYKTEFMANMSHELRTPLNSILLLSRLLMENKENTLTPKQYEFAKTVHSAGEDLLNLINEVLDLAKVESGKMEIELAPVSVRAVTHAWLVAFTPLAEQKGITFSVHVAPDVPDQVTTDRKRLEQIVKNFLSNAFKFTRRGSVRLEMGMTDNPHGDGDWASDRSGGQLTISVVDTGIGIPASKQATVFEAFQQVDGSTRRKYGGTGLGLSISRELARLLAGRITLQSEVGHGSRFTLHLPMSPLRENEPAVIHSDALGTAVVRTAASPPRPVEPDPSRLEPVPDDRHRLTPGDRSVLIVDADAATTEPIKTAAHRHGYKVLVAERGSTGRHLADYYRPTGIFLNLDLPEADAEDIIARIKANPPNRHTPVFTLATAPNALQAAVVGAAAHLRPPLTDDHLDAAFARLASMLSAEAWSILVVAPDREVAARTAATIRIPAVRCLTATSVDRAEAVLKTETIHALIFHPTSDARVCEMIIGALDRRPMPMYHYSGNPPVAIAPIAVEPLNQRVRPKRIGTPDDLLVALVADLAIPAAALDDDSRGRLQAMDEGRNALNGRAILLIDDDMRTVFAVSNALEDQGAVVHTGKTGKESLDKMDAFPDIDLILMDVMIAEVDGYQAMRAIRRRNRYRDVPIIALTAKAMQGDRAKCIQAGADDYLAKPVNLDKLISMLRIWLEPWPTRRPEPVSSPSGQGGR